MRRLLDRPPVSDWTKAPAIRKATRKKVEKKKKSYGVEPNRITSVLCRCVVFFVVGKAPHGASGDAGKSAERVKENEEQDFSV